MLLFLLLPIHKKLVRLLLLPLHSRDSFLSLSLPSLLILHEIKYTHTHRVHYGLTWLAMPLLYLLCINIKCNRVSKRPHNNWPTIFQLSLSLTSRVNSIDATFKCLYACSPGACLSPCSSQIIPPHGERERERGRKKRHHSQTQFQASQLCMCARHAYDKNSRVRVRGREKGKEAT